MTEIVCVCVCMCVAHWLKVDTIYGWVGEAVLIRRKCRGWGVLLCVCVRVCVLDIPPDCYVSAFTAVRGGEKERGFQVRGGNKRNGRDGNIPRVFFLCRVGNLHTRASFSFSYHKVTYYLLLLLPSSFYSSQSA